MKDSVNVHWKCDRNRARNGKINAKLWKRVWYNSNFKTAGRREYLQLPTRATRGSCCTIPDGLNGELKLVWVYAKGGLKSFHWGRNPHHIFCALYCVCVQVIPLSVFQALPGFRRRGGGLGDDFLARLQSPSHKNTAVNADCWVKLLKVTKTRYLKIV